MAYDHSLSKYGVDDYVFLHKVARPPFEGRRIPKNATLKANDPKFSIFLMSPSDQIHYIY